MKRLMIGILLLSAAPIVAMAADKAPVDLKQECRNCGGHTIAMLRSAGTILFTCAHRGWTAAQKRWFSKKEI